MRFPLSSDLLWRLPRHPDWKYERIDGQARLSPRPPPVAVSPSHRRRGPDRDGRRRRDARPIDAGPDRAGIVELLVEVWVDEDPYRSLEDGEAVLRAEIERSVIRADLQGAVAVDVGGVCATVLVTFATSTPPTFTWLTVRRQARGQGFATALLGVVVDGLAARGVRELASEASAANVPSLPWHLARGFQLSPDPLPEALRRTRP